MQHNGVGLRFHPVFYYRLTPSDLWLYNHLMLEEDITPEAASLTSTVWIENELRRIMHDRDAHAVRWQQLVAWLQAYPEVRVPVSDVLRYMDVADPRNDATGVP
jgi:hypothetical protein